MKVYITRDWKNKTYEIWNKKPTRWCSEGFYDGTKSDSSYFCDTFESFVNEKNEGIISEMKPSTAKKLFNLPRHLKKREIAEGTMTFKVKVK